MGFIGATPTPVPLTNSDLDSNIALGTWKCRYDWRFL